MAISVQSWVCESAVKVIERVFTAGGFISIFTKCYRAEWPQLTMCWSVSLFVTPCILNKTTIYCHDKSY